MAQRYTTPVSTRVAGAVVSSADENSVDSRVVQLSADLGGVPGDLNTTDNSSYAAAINEVVTREAAMELPRQVAGCGFVAKGSQIADVVYTGESVYRGTTGAGEFWAPIELPDGIEPTGLRVWASLGNTVAEVDVTLVAAAKDGVSGGGGALAQVTLVGSAGYQNDVDTISHTVDNSTYVYYLKAVLTNDSANLAILKAAEVY